MQLNNEGVMVNHKTVHKLMTQLGPVVSISIGITTRSETRSEKSLPMSLTGTLLLPGRLKSVLRMSPKYAYIM